jgi:hypothetical protein
MPEILPLPLILNADDKEIVRDALEALHKFEQANNFLNPQARAAWDAFNRLIAKYEAVPESERPDPRFEKMVRKAHTRALQTHTKDKP